MLITHHSVMPERLPVTLTFVQWNACDWIEKIDDVPPTPLLPHPPPPSEKRHSHITPHRKPQEIDEKRNSKFYNNQERRIEDFETPKRRSRVYLESYRHSRFIDIA
ncbi:hypothetical protein KIN20_009395 [Parelaphostrongylus tenuis]|uniref:Uncharacterized protein n=1 Tax=Parelaphostrongylus tenuis TaxID=148309 RepID=A0AAD5M852_PARTN|nr:hypothetical protein KIN20_009395 [Parelaphostrongylus tenuis]